MITVSEHAQERYRERVRDVLDVEGEIVLLAGVCGRVQFEPPAWRGWSDQPVEVWLMLGDDVAFPLVRGTAVTCIARGGMSDTARAGRNGHNARVRSARRVQRAMAPQKMAKVRRLER